ncbi:hypothetical protein Tco_1517340 [Tanacetum coccineum]
METIHVIFDEMHQSIAPVRMIPSATDTNAQVVPPGTSLSTTIPTCTVITKVLLLFAVTMSSPLYRAPLNTSTYGTISSESKWKIEWLNSTSWETNNPACQTILAKALAKRTVLNSSFSR